MIFTAICICGVLFVVVSLPFALRYEARRRKLPRKYTWKDWAWEDDPQFDQRFPNHIPGPPRSRADNE